MKEGMKEKLMPMSSMMEGFDGSVPFATIEGWDPRFNDSLSITCRTPEEFMANWTTMTNMARGESHTYAGKYLFHAVGRPAIRFFNGSEAWFKDGVLHNTEGPAMKMGNMKVWAINGHITPEELFDDYMIYVARMAKAPNRASQEGKILTFPNRYEIKDANKYGLFLYFDYDLNYYWMNESGNLHHPTEPAFQGFNGLVQHWKYGELISERVDSGMKATNLDEIRKLVDQAWGPKYASADAVLTDLDKEDLRPLFTEAGRMFEAGYGLDEIVDWFGRAYGDGWPDDFARSLIEDFKGLTETVVEHMERSGVFARVPPNLIEKIEQRANELLVEESQLLKKFRTEKDKIVDDLRAQAEREVTLLGQIKTQTQVPEPINFKPYMEAIETKAPEVLTIPSAKAKIVAAAQKLEAAASGAPEQLKLEAETGAVSESKDSGWVVPLGALAVAGLVGFLGGKKESAEVSKQLTEVAVVER